jgi:hypothetical protein
MYFAQGHRGRSFCSSLPHNPPQTGSRAEAIDTIHRIGLLVLEGPSTMNQERMRPFWLGSVKAGKVISDFGRRTGAQPLLERSSNLGPFSGPIFAELDCSHNRNLIDTANESLPSPRPTRPRPQILKTNRSHGRAALQPQGRPVPCANSRSRPARSPLISTIPSLINCCPVQS